jgi:hypothetical protein
MTNGRMTAAAPDLKFIASYSGVSGYIKQIGGVFYSSIKD